MSAVAEESVQLVTHLWLVLLTPNTRDRVAAVILELGRLLQEAKQVAIELLLDLWVLEDDIV